MFPETTLLNRRGSAAPATLRLFACIFLLLFQAASLLADQQTSLPLTIHRSNQVIGTVWALGKRPPSLRLPVFKNIDFCGVSVPDQSLRSDHDGRLQAAAVILEPLSRSNAAPPLRSVLDNFKCAFTPRVQIVPAGSEVVLMNSDPILHAVHARLGQETLFNVGLPTWRQVTKVFKNAGIVTIDCDVLHTWMQAFVVVTSSPYYAVTDERGYFQIDHVPAGIYDMVVWHERLGRKTMRIAVSSAKTTAFDVAYRLK